MLPPQLAICCRPTTRRRGLASPTKSPWRALCRPPAPLLRQCCISQGPSYLNVMTISSHLPDSDRDVMSKSRVISRPQHGPELLRLRPHLLRCVGLPLRCPGDLRIRRYGYGCMEHRMKLRISRRSTPPGEKYKPAAGCHGAEKATRAGRRPWKTPKTAASLIRLVRTIPSRALRPKVWNRGIRIQRLTLFGFRKSVRL